MMTNDFCEQLATSHKHSLSFIAFTNFIIIYVYDYHCSPVHSPHTHKHTRYTQIRTN